MNRVKRKGTWYATALCPDCKTPRLVPEKTIQEDGTTINKCASCGMKGKRNRGPGETLKIGSIRSIRGKQYIRLKEGNGPGTWRVLVPNPRVPKPPKPKKLKSKYMAPPPKPPTAIEIVTEYLKRDPYDSEKITYPGGEIPTPDNITISVLGTPLKNIPLKEFKW